MIVRLSADVYHAEYTVYYKHRRSDALPDDKPLEFPVERPKEPVPEPTPKERLEPIVRAMQKATPQPAVASSHATKVSSTKKYVHANGLSCCFRQWRADSHCKYLHGYSLSVELTFHSNALDKNGWVMDFGGLKPVKLWLEGVFDHKTVIASDDPQLETFKGLARAGVIDLVILPAVGCEAFAEMVLHWTNIWIDHTDAKGRVWCESVRIQEHEGNGATAWRQ